MRHLLSFVGCNGINTSVGWDGGLLGAGGSVLLTATGFSTEDFPALFFTNLLTAFVNVNTQTDTPSGVSRC